MIMIPVLMADADAPGLREVLKGSGHSAGLELVLIFGAMAIVVVATFLWAAFFRKQPAHPSYSTRRRPRREPRSSTSAQTRKQLPEIPESRRRHRRRNHRPRNPTLAETCGLPPVRETGAAPNPPAGPAEPWKRAER
jgi:hypothetical protein